MKSENSIKPGSKLLPLEEAPWDAFKIYLWRFISVLFLFSLIIFSFWLLQLAHVGWSAFASKLFALLWVAVGGWLILVFAGIATPPDRGMVAILGLKGWISFHAGKWLIQPSIYVATIPAKAARLLPVAPLDVKLLKLSLGLQYSWYRYVQSWIELPLKLFAKSGIPLRKFSDDFRESYDTLKRAKEDIKRHIVQNRKFMQRLSEIERQRDEDRRRNISELSKGILTLFNISQDLDITQGLK